MATAKPPGVSNHIVFKPPGYKVEEILGHGTFSEVYKATNNVTNVSIALKCFRFKMVTATNYHLAAKEIAFLDILEHPNILSLKMYEINKIFAYIGTELAAFGSLRCYIRDRQEPIPELIIKHVMRQILSALDYLHVMGVLHGDLKPENVLCTNLTENGPIIKIGDFGLSIIKLSSESMLFKSGSFMYMAPEVHLCYPVDCSCDLWSAGVIMYIMMFGRHMFGLRDKDKEKITACLKRRTPPNWQGCETFSDECNHLVRSLLAYDKQNRVSGKDLRTHPFVNIGEPNIPQARAIFLNARQDIHTAIDLAKEKKYGEALVKGIESVMRLKIHYNLISDTQGRKMVKHKWEEYGRFNMDMERILALPEDREPSCPDHCTDDVFRMYLASTPRLLSGFDIGCNAEMYLREGQTEKALQMFHQALRELLPLIKTEPKSNRKKILGRRGLGGAGGNPYRETTSSGSSSGCSCPGNISSCRTCAF